MEQVLPRESGMYLKIILGTVNVSILDKKARYDYKDQYEQFKLIVNLIGKMLNIWFHAYVAFLSNQFHLGIFWQQKWYAKTYLI